ncbi:hypothetical protein MFFC18_13500 [Mariniblastus fucicola]|uniref:Uncharacterized protein n=1 Tax=Mariniblastus fucicola TaxID=980251 RepID=A0A5B9P5F6_9BACT|nr:hypothetical protein MFFC18_13500 [Mariniblastus fucicola]
MPDDSPSWTSRGFRIYGYLVLLIVAGAILGYRLAHEEPVTPWERASRRLAEAQTLEQIVPFALVGASIGLFVGCVLERWLPDWKPAYWVFGILAIVLLWMAT